MTSNKKGASTGNTHTMNGINHSQTHHHNNTAIDVCLLVCALSIALLLVSEILHNEALKYLSIGAMCASGLPILNDNMRVGDDYGRED